MTRLRIGLDARECTDPRTGMGRYALAVIPLLAARGHHEYVVWLPPNGEVPASLRAQVETVTSAVPAYSPLEHVQLGREIRGQRLDLFHAMTYALPVWAGVKTTMTLFDVVPLLYPRQYSRWARAYWRVIVPRTAAHARRIVTLSRHSRADIARLLPVAAERIDVLPAGVGPPFTPGDGGRALRQRYPFLTRRYVLVHGNQRPHKNIDATIAAWSQLGRRPDPPLLVLSGGPALDGPILDGLIARLGPVDDATLVELYRNALLYLLPSLHEGAGLTPLEAMACGAPCLLADRAALPELYRGAAAFDAATDPHALAAAVTAIADDPKRRAELVVAGHALAADHSWEAAAAALEATLEAAVLSAPRR